MRVLRGVVLVLGWVLLGGGPALGQARLGPYVVDGNGLKIGHVSDENYVLMFVDGHPVKVEAGPNGFGVAALTLYFIDGACNTQALLGAQPAPPGGAFFGYGHYTTDGVIHYTDGAAAPVAETEISSVQTINADGTPGACDAATTSYYVAPALSGSIGVFALPFTVVDALPVSPAPASATFNDVPIDHPFFRFVEALSASGITAGCQAAPPLYCPDSPMTRGQMAVFLAKALGL